MAKIISAYIEITGACNASCPYCYNKKMVGSGKIIEYPMLLSLVNQLNSMNINHITLSGGEPFLYENLSDILYEMKLKNMSANIITNGYCFNESSLPILLKYQPNIQLTFDGFDSVSHDATRGSGNFTLITKGIKKARQCGYSGLISIRLNLTKSNVFTIDKMLDMLENYGVDGVDARDIDSIGASLVHRPDIEDENYDDYIEQREQQLLKQVFISFENWNNKHDVKIEHDLYTPDIGCPYNLEVENIECGIRIAVNGYVYPCQSFTDSRFALGDIHLSTLQEIINGSAMKKFVDLVKNRQSNIAECNKCAYVHVCKGGCPAVAFRENGTLNSVSALCDFRKQHIGSRLIELIEQAEGARS